MSEFYRDEQTRKAEAVLHKLHEIVPDAIIIGGWAAFLYGGGQRSTDVDIAVQFVAFSKLQRAFGNAIEKKPHLSKYEMKLDGVSIDILVEYYSDPGIPIELLLEPHRTISGFQVMSPEGLLALKVCAWQDRRNRTKGDKDESDVLGNTSEPGRLEKM